MYISKDRLFVATLCFALVMTTVFAGAVYWDFANNRDNGKASVRTVSVDVGADTSPSPVAGVATTGGSAATAGTTHKTGGGTASGAASGQVIAPGAPIVIGALITQSGPLDASDAFRADEAWVQMTNSQGGINGHKIVLDVKDDQGNPAVGRSAFEQIVQEDKALALVGECGPVTDATIVDEINQQQVPVVNDCLTSAPAYSSPYIWYSTTRPSTWQAIAANYIFKNQDAMKMHKPYILCVNSSVTLVYCDGFSQSWAKNGGTMCYNRTCSTSAGYDQEQVGQTRSQYDSIAQQIKSSGADSIAALLEPTNQAALMQALQDQGMTPAQGWPDFGPLGMDPNSIRAAGAAANGVYVCTGDSYFPSENTPGEQKLAAALARYQPDTPMDNYALSIGWTPMVLFGEALRRVGPNVSRQALINALDSMKGFDTGGLSRPVEWTNSNRLAPPYTRWATVTGPTSYNVITGWIDQNGNPAP
jgi:ABC-type branched-subunit amino acid transport system substrate-binding protein